MLVISGADILLLKDEKDPKCFTRTGEDFTCFFETADNLTYDLLYTSGRLQHREKMSIQRPEEGTFLHIYSFPSSDVFMYEPVTLEVVEHNTNTTLYYKTVYVEEHFLFEPSHNVTLHQNGQVGQLQTKVSTHPPTNTEKLDSLVPGDETEVQVAAKCGFDLNAGHWSSWSHPVRAIVPQSADDVSLMCYTPELQNIICQWNGSRYGVEREYKLFYKIGDSEQWTECVTDGRFTDLCFFPGDESRKVSVMLNSTRAPLRTFYAQEFTLNKIIKTSPPRHLKAALQKERLCLNWEAPLQSLSAHLQYEVGYQMRRGDVWLSSKGPETSRCLEVSAGNQYNVKVRAIPTGPTYSGHWSDWSDVMTGHNPTNFGMWFVLCIPASLLITAIIIHMYLSKLKQFFWPPVPNLDKVLQGFLTDINWQKWEPPLTIKQCPEETTASVVEIMSEDEVSGLGKPSEESTQLISPEGSLSSGEQVETQVFPDYVTLSKDSVINCPEENKNMYEKVGEKAAPGMGGGLPQTCQCSCTKGSVCVPPCFGKDFLNHTYVPLAEAADRFDYRVTPARGPGNLYTNLPSS
ncbi:hypothetical protein INR49_023999 [Caranx melampygus]|nr:hypothetical protein INR49_023999 [Caranx melampygus]